MWLRQWTLQIDITIVLGLAPAFIQWFSSKCHTQGIFNWRGGVLRTHLLMFSLIWYEVIIGLKCRILAIFHVYQGKNFAPNFTTEDFRISARGPLANSVYGCHVTPVTRGALGYVSCQKGIIQGHLVHRYAQKKNTILCSRIVFWAVLSLDVSTQTVSLYYMSVKYTLKHYFGCFWCPCYALAVMWNRWNQYNFVTLHRLYIYGGTVEL